MESALPQITLGSILNQGMSATTSRLHQSSQSFQRTLGRSITEGVSQENSYARLADIGRTISSQNTLASQVINEQAKSFIEKFGISDQHTDAIKGVFIAQAAGGLTSDAVNKQLSKFVSKGRDESQVDLRGNIVGRGENSTNDDTTTTGEDISQFTQGINYTESQKQQLTNQLAQGFSERSQKSSKELWGDSSSKSLSKSARELISVAKTHNEIQQLQKSFGGKINSNVRTLAAAVCKNEGAYHDLIESFSIHANRETRQDASDLSGHYQRVFGMTTEIANVAGMLTALHNTGRHSPEEADRAFNIAIQAISRATSWYPGVDYPSAGKTTTSDSDLAPEVDRATANGPPSRDSNNIGNQARTQIPRDGQVQKEYERDQRNLKTSAQQTNRQVSSTALKKARSYLMHALPEKSRTVSLWGGWNNANAWLVRRRDQLGDALYAGSNENARTFNQAMEQLSNLTPEQREQFTTALKQDDQQLQQHFGGKLASAALKLGNEVIGAATTGYDQAQQWLTGKSGLSEAAKHMTLEERGAYYSSAFMAAASAGVKETARFMREHGNEFKQTLAETAQHRYGLTATQAAVYAESFDTNKERMASAVHNLKMEYAEKDINGNTLLDNNGNPLLSAENNKFTNQLVNVLQNAADAGDRAGSYLTPLRGYNIANKNFK